MQAPGAASKGVCTTHREEDGPSRKVLERETSMNPNETRVFKKRKT